MAQEFKRPIELAGLKGRLLRAKELDAQIGATGREYDAVLDAIDEKHSQATAHLGQLKRYDSELGDVVTRMIGTGEGSNNPPTEGPDGSDPSGPGIHPENPEKKENA